MKDLITELETLSGWNVPETDRLEWLLRKLPKFAHDAEFCMTNDGAGWTVGYATDAYGFGQFHFVMSESADTPEDAAAKLCIELIKNGVLKP
jgi:hypothetical protein